MLFVCQCAPEAEHKYKLKENIYLTLTAQSLEHIDLTLFIRKDIFCDAFV